jgi:hypothetical protein
MLAAPDVRHLIIPADIGNAFSFYSSPSQRTLANCRKIIKELPVITNASPIPETVLKT